MHYRDLHLVHVPVRARAQGNLRPHLRPGVQRHQPTWRELNVTSTLCYDFLKRRIFTHVDFWAPSNFDLCEPLPGPVEEEQSQMYVSASVTYQCQGNLCLLVYLIGKGIAMVLRAE